jgi:hypothetical protein
MPPTFPFWFKQRQCSAEPAGGDHVLRVSGPNLAEAYLSITPGENNHWRAALRFAPGAPDVAVTEAEFDNPRAAWDAAFELYRTHVIV